MSIRALIIDDDPFMRDLLRDKVEQHLPEVQIVGSADHGAGGIELIANTNPDLVFLDVEMPDMTGFEMLNQLEEIGFATIFCTSYNHYAIKAIRFNALDYLVKPVDLGELKAAVQRYREAVQAGQNTGNVNQALNNMKSSNPAEEVLTLQLQDRELAVRLGDIIRVEGERNYSSIHTTDGRKHLTSKTLVTFEDLLAEKGFYRSHKSHLVNRDHITSIHRDGTVEMSDGSRPQVSRRRAEAFRDWFGG